jgi:alanine racemase
MQNLFNNLISSHRNDRLMIAVKANGYGHGAVQIAQTAIQSGADSLAVARVEEGLELRKAGIGAPILILGYTAAHWAETLVAEQLVPTIFSLENARDLSAAAVSQKAVIPSPYTSKSIPAWDDWASHVTSFAHKKTTA